MRPFFLYITVFTLLMPSALQAQMLYNPVKLDVGVALGELSEHHAGFITPYMELKFNLTNQITLGGRLEYIYFSKKDNPFTNATNETLYWKNIKSDGSISSVMLTGDYYFNTRSLRPFAGVGLGGFYASLKEKNAFINKDENLYASGGMLRLGVVIDHFRFAMEYNYIPNSITNLNYLTIKLGIEIGGVKKRFIKP